MTHVWIPFSVFESLQRALAPLAITSTCSLVYPKPVHSNDKQTRKLSPSQTFDIQRLERVIIPTMNRTPVEKIIDIDQLVTHWSPEERRDERTGAGHQKVDATIQGKEALIGGAFLANRDEDAVTLSFAFQGRDGKTYGLTVAHNWESCGDPVYAYSSNTYDDPHTRKYPLEIIGNVVHLSETTDSMIFEFQPHVKVDLHKIKLGPTIKHDLLPALTNWSSASGKINTGTKICAFGAQRRGTASIARSIFRGNDHPDLLKSDVGIDSFGPDGFAKKIISHGGDCGMIYCDEQGNPLLMHHVLTGEGDPPNTVYKSWGVPFKSILKANHRYFGIDVSAQTDSHEISNLQSTSPQKGSIVVRGATRLENVEYLPGHAPSSHRHVRIGTGSVRLTNVQYPPDEAMDDV